MNHTVRFKITTAKGETFTGPVQGSGGLIGAGASHCAPDVQEWNALRCLRHEIKHADEGEPLSIYEPKPGCCAINNRTNDDTFETRKPDTIVPLKGASAEILNPSPISHAGRVARGKREILDDVRLGRVPRAINCFSDLHGHVDANAYGGFCDEGKDAIPSLPNGDVDIDAINAVQNELDAWLRKGGAS